MQERIISIDIAKGDCKDHSAIVTFCGNCKYILESKTYEPDLNELQCTVYKKCPECGAKFRGGRIIEE